MIKSEGAAQVLDIKPVIKGHGNEHKVIQKRTLQVIAQIDLLFLTKLGMAIPEKWNLLDPSIYGTMRMFVHDSF